MDNYRTNRLDHIWMMVVLIHVVGATAIGLVLTIPYGLVVLNSLFWIYVILTNKNIKMIYIISGIGWSITMYILLHMTLEYQSSFLMNAFIFMYILWVHYGNFPLLLKENHIGLPKVKEWIAIIPLTVCFIVIGIFINNLSMYYFQNHVDNALKNASAYPLSSFFVLAFAPAVVEELVFRGFVFQRIGRGKKAIIVSAIMFALCHMNFNQMSYALVMGFLLAGVYFVTDNLLVSILIHFLFNASSVFNAVYGRPDFMKILDRLDIGFVLALVAGIITFGIFKWLKKEIVENEGKEKWIPGFGFYLGAIICMGIAVLMK